MKDNITANILIHLVDLNWQNIIEMPFLNLFYRILKRNYKQPIYHYDNLVDYRFRKSCYSFILYSD